MLSTELLRPPDQHAVSGCVSVCVWFCSCTCVCVGGGGGGGDAEFVQCQMTKANTEEPPNEEHIGYNAVLSFVESSPLQCDGR